MPTTISKKNTSTKYGAQCYYILILLSRRNFPQFSLPRSLGCSFKLCSLFWSVAATISGNVMVASP